MRLFLGVQKPEHTTTYAGRRSHVIFLRTSATGTTAIRCDGYHNAADSLNFEYHGNDPLPCSASRSHSLQPTGTAPKPPQSFPFQAAIESQISLPTSARALPCFGCQSLRCGVSPRARNRDLDRGHLLVIWHLLFPSPLRRSPYHCTSSHYGGFLGRFERYKVPLQGGLTGEPHPM